MKLALIVAMAEDRAIGKDNQLLWHLSADLKRFKTLTTGHSIIMGRKTYESLPNGALPNRRNIVLSKSLDQLDGVEVLPSLEAALQLCADEERVFVIGGGCLYEASLALADELYLTEVQATYPDADTYFPAFDREEWQEIEREVVELDERNPLRSIYSYLIRRK